MQDNKKDKQQYEVKLTVKNSINLDTFDPVPITYNNNSFRYVSGKKYIPFIGYLDNLPSLLLEARLTSVTQNACISSIAQSVVGKGIAVQDVQDPNPDLLKWFKCVNNKQQSLNDVARATFDGERSFGNQFIEIKRGEVAGKRFVKIYLHSMLHTRLKEPDDDYSDPDSVIISKQIQKVGYVPLRDPLIIPLWSPNVLDQSWKDNEDGTQSTMLHFKNEVSGVEYYGQPASIAGLRYQIEESKLVQYNIDNLNNNMVLGGMLILKSAMTAEEAEAKAKEILLSHVGDGKTGRIAVISSESGLDDVKFEQYNTQKEGSFKERDKTLEQKIIIANNYDAMLLGMEHTGSLGKGSGYIRSIYDTVDAKLFNPLERKFMEKVMNPIMQIYAEWMNVKEVLDYTFHFETSMPYSFMGDIDPTLFMKVKQAQKLAGMQPDEAIGEKYLCEMKTTSNNVQTEPVTP